MCVCVLVMSNGERVVLALGGAGTVGSGLVKALLDRGKNMQAPKTVRVISAEIYKLRVNSDLRFFAMLMVGYELLKKHNKKVTYLTHVINVL